MVENDIAMSAGVGTLHFDFSSNGTLIFVPALENPPPYRIVTVDRRRNIETLLESQVRPNFVSVSPDGNRLALELSGANETIWLYDIRRKLQTKLSNVFGDTLQPVWTPDSAWITFATVLPRSLISVAADLSNKEKKIWIADVENQPAVAVIRYPSWSGDGRYMAFEMWNSETRGDVFYLAAQSNPNPVAYLQTPFDEKSPRISPSGSWLAYESDESERGKYDIYIDAFPTRGRKVQISTNGGTAARWSRDGRELFFRQGTKVVVIPLEISSTVTPGKPQVIADGSYAQPYDIMPNGQLVFIQSPEIRPTTHLNLVLNWFAELTRLCPTGRK